MKIETKYMKVFNTEAEYVEYEASSSFIIPSVSYVITSKNTHYAGVMSYTPPTSKSNMLYNGMPQEIVNPGEAFGGEIYYATSSEGASSSTTVPTATNVGSYTVYWKAVPNSGHIGGTSSWASLSTSIDKTNRTISWESKPNTLKFLNTITAVAIIGDSEGTISYSSSDSSIATINSSTGVITPVASGECTITATVAATANYNSATTSYTLSVIDQFAGHEYIDLGLPSGTLWATANVVTQSNNFYQYGKGTRPYQQTSGETPYNGTENPLSYSVDTARQAWGGDWHMPTREQWLELMTQCSWSYDSGSNFFRVSRDGKTVFINVNGSYVDNMFINSLAFYLTSTPADGSNWDAYYVVVNSNGARSITAYQTNRVGGIVRGVVG